MKTINQTAVEQRNTLQRALPVATGVALAVAAGSANAAIDIAPITELITQAVTAATAIGIAFLGFVAGMAIYKKLRGAT